MRCGTLGGLDDLLPTKLILARFVLVDFGADELTVSMQAAHFILV